MFPKNILVYSNGELIGDGMMKLPFIKALKTSFPTAKITWLCGRHPTIFKTALYPLVEDSIDKVIDQTHIGNHWHDLWQKPWKKHKDLESYYDMIIDTERKPLSSIILKQIPHKQYISASTGWFFSDKKPLKPYKDPCLLLNRLLDLVWVASNQRVTPSSVVDVPKKWQELAKTLLPSGNLVALAPGAGGRFKCWPLINFVNLAKKLKEANYLPIFILGPAETEWQDEIKNHLPDALFPLQQTIEKSPYLTIALAQQAKLVIANDGGVGHILAASGKPIISLWGPTDPNKSTPNNNHVTIVRSQDFGGKSMSDIPVQAVFEKALNLLY
jgi:ADP-heptose:LPS heptosyltransferase